MPHWNFIHLSLPKGSGGFRSPKTHPKGSFWLTWVGRLIEKESGFHGCEQARPDGLRSLFLRASRARTAQPSGPAASLCGSALGRTPFRCGETSGLRYRAVAAAYSTPLILPQQNGGTDALRTTAAIRRAVPRQRNHPTSNTKRWLSGGCREGLWPPKPPPCRLLRHSSLSLFCISRFFR